MGFTIACPRFTPCVHILLIFGFHLFEPMLSASSVFVGNHGLIVRFVQEPLLYLPERQWQGSERAVRKQ